MEVRADTVLVGDRIRCRHAVYGFERVTRVDVVPESRHVRIRTVNHDHVWGTSEKIDVERKS